MLTSQKKKKNIPPTTAEVITPVKSALHGEKRINKIQKKVDKNTLDTIERQVHVFARDRQAASPFVYLTPTMHTRTRL